MNSGTGDTVSGASYAVVAANGLGIDIKGTDAGVFARTNDQITLGSGSSMRLSGSSGTVTAATGDAFKVSGIADVVYAGLNDAITDGGVGAAFKINGNVGALSVSGFGSDPTGVFELLAGAGGYATAAAAVAALTSDGSGGSKLSLGSEGSIDILNVAPSSLHLSNFKIG